jgi:hypothetical protein
LLVSHENVQRPGKESFILIRPDGFVACSGPAAGLGRAGVLLDRLAAAEASAVTAA